jgi:hypothetical protein
MNNRLDELIVVKCRYWMPARLVNEPSSMDGERGLTNAGHVESIGKGHAKNAVKERIGDDPVQRRAV